MEISPPMTSTQVIQKIKAGGELIIRHQGLVQNKRGLSSGMVLLPRRHIEKQNLSTAQKLHSMGTGLNNQNPHHYVTDLSQGPGNMLNVKNNLIYLLHPLKRKNSAFSSVPPYIRRKLADASEIQQLCKISKASHPRCGDVFPLPTTSSGTGSKPLSHRQRRGTWFQQHSHMYKRWKMKQGKFHQKERGETRHHNPNDKLQSLSGKESEPEEKVLLKIRSPKRKYHHSFIG
ncbi:hypothetical protein PoB_006742100 [Plakobranchus ocellatus]|uniref:Uncharacterized protein n=1 Tax=Plakobranchus ocellatus TaxID=259542 RepID=A0AAV4D9S3_9GAST|nr:hypothetical protein PoB_006742100 [Plakobranchus ocellatus]